MKHRRSNMSKLDLHAAFITMGTGMLLSDLTSEQCDFMITGALAMHGCTEEELKAFKLAIAKEATAFVDSQVNIEDLDEEQAGFREKLMESFAEEEARVAGTKH
jgi:hypothetical protein